MSLLRAKGLVTSTVENGKHRDGHDYQCADLCQPHHAHALAKIISFGNSFDVSRSEAEICKRREQPNECNRVRKCPEHFRSYEASYHDATRNSDPLANDCQNR